MTSSLINVRTGSHSGFIDITSQVNRFLSNLDVSEGLCNIFIPHTTCGITINENADPDVKSDLLMELAKMVPIDDGYRHMEGNSAAHLKASIMGFDVTVPFIDGRLALGTWQGVYLCEFDGPGNRTVRISVQA